MFHTIFTSYSLTLYIKSYHREDSKRETEVTMKIIMEISQCTHLFPAAPIPDEWRAGIKGESKGKGTLPSLVDPLRLNKNNIAKYINIAKYHFRKQTVNQTTNESLEFSNMPFHMQC